MNTAEKEFTIALNGNIKRNVLRTKLIPNGDHWYFDNGQYGQKVLCVEGNEYYLSYHYNRVYFNYCRYNDSGWSSMGSQTPLSKVKDPGKIEYAKMIFQADKQCGVIPNKYPFE